MTNIKTNYDIFYENHKKKIVFNIYTDIKDDEFISLPKTNNNINNNDTLNFVINILLFLKSNLFSLYKYIMYHFPSFIRTFYKIQYIMFIIFLLFSFAYTLEDNSNISTNLIFSAYFKTSTRLTYFRYDKLLMLEHKIQEKKKKKIIINKNKEIINNNNDKTIDCENRFINDDIKSLMSSSANAKNTYVNYEKKTNNKSINKDEFFLFFVIPIKSCIFSIISLILLYFFIKITYTSKISRSFIFNIFCIFLIYNLNKGLYENNYYLASAFMFILQIYLLKSLIDSIYLLLNYKKKDFEIFSTNLTAINCQQFILKFILLSLITTISGFMCSSIYKLCLNYIIFYLCLLTLIVFLCNCLEPFSPSYLKPIKNILMFIVGLVNFAVCKYYFSKNNNSIFDIDSDDIISIEKEDEDIIIYESSLYFISDLFSLFCFDYLREYIDYQFEGNLQFHKKFTKLDFIIIIFFLSSFGIGILGIIKNEYICFLLAIYIAKISLGYFIKAFNTKISRIISHSVIIFYIFAHLKLSSRKDPFLINFFSFTKINNEILSQAFSILSLLFLIFFGKNIYSFLYYSKESLNNDELKELPEEQVNKILEITSNINKQKLKNLKIQIIHDNNNFKINNIFFISIDICLNHFEICIIFAILSENNDNNFIIKILYLILIILFKSIKFFVINEIQNKVEYFSIFLISFMLTLKLLLFSESTSVILYFICQINLLLLIILYSFNNKKNKFINIILVFHLFFQLSQINFFFMTIDLISLIFSPIIKDYLSKKFNTSSKNIKNERKGELNKAYNLSLLLFLFILIIFSLQLYGVHKYQKILNYFIIILNKNNNENIDDELDSNKRKKIPIEYYIINKIISLLRIKE